VGPPDITWLPEGIKLSGAFAAIGRLQEIAASIAQTTASQDQTTAEWERRSVDCPTNESHPNNRVGTDRTSKATSAKLATNNRH
jgi:Flp pilus assembly protein TadG